MDTRYLTTRRDKPKKDQRYPLGDRGKAVPPAAIKTEIDKTPFKPPARWGMTAREFYETNRDRVMVVRFKSGRELFGTIVGVDVYDLLFQPTPTLDQHTVVKLIPKSAIEVIYPLPASESPAGFKARYGLTDDSDGDRDHG